MSRPKIVALRAVLNVMYEDGTHGIIQAPSFKKNDIRHGLTFTDEETFATIEVSMATVAEMYEHFGGSDGLHKYLKGISATPPTGPPPSQN